MNLLEYQAKTILEEAGLRTPRGIVIRMPRDCAKIRDRMYPSGYVVKAQVASGGRGKAGGVKIVSKAKEAREAARAMLGSALATRQSGGPVKISSVLVAEKVTIEKEYYLAAALSRKRAQPVLLMSASGGMDIEEITQKDPAALIELPIETESGAPSWKLRRLAARELKVPAAWINNFIDTARKAAAAYVNRELFLLEINPLALTPKGFMAVDAKISVDENALPRQNGNAATAHDNESLMSALERKARRLSVSYVPIGGQIGCLVNGAGLAMATMDLIAGHGRSPANFLDVGGGAQKDQIRGAFELLLANRSLGAIFVNIFGGIMRCDVIAQALIEANQRLPLKVPLVARLLGNNVDLAKEILSKAKLKGVEVHSDLETAVQSVCAKVPGGSE